MIGMMYLLALGVYLLLSLGVVRWAIRYAREKGRSAKRWGWSAVLVMYLIPFWDWLPTVAVHQYYCATESGFWVYKTLDQWKKENPGVMETLVDNSPNEYPNWPSENWNGQTISSINLRFGMLYKNHLSRHEEGEFFLNVWRWQTELVDKNTGEVLARRVDFSTGNDGHIGGMHSTKFWLSSSGCIGGTEHVKSFGEFLKPIRGVKK